MARHGKVCILFCISISSKPFVPNETWDYEGQMPLDVQHPDTVPTDKWEPMSAATHRNAGQHRWHGRTRHFLSHRGEGEEGRGGREAWTQTRTWRHMTTTAEGKHSLSSGDAGRSVSLTVSVQGEGLVRWKGEGFKGLHPLWKNKNKKQNKNKPKPPLWLHFISFPVAAVLIESFAKLG